MLFTFFFITHSRMTSQRLAKPDEYMVRRHFCFAYASYSKEKNVSGEGVGKSLTRVMNWYANRLVHILGCGAKSTRGSECLCTHLESNELYYG